MLINGDFVDKKMHFLKTKFRWNPGLPGSGDPESEHNTCKANHKTGTGVQEKHAKVVTLQKGIHFKTKGGKSGKSAAEPHTQEQCGLGGHPVIFQGKSQDDTQYETANDVNQKRSQVQMGFTGIEIGANKIAQYTTHSTTQKNKKYVFHLAPFYWHEDGTIRGISLIIPLG